MLPDNNVLSTEKGEQTKDISDKINSVNLRGNTSVGNIKQATEPFRYLKNLKHIAKSKNIIFFDADAMLNKSIPIKIYEMKGHIQTIPDHTHDYIQLWYVARGEFLHKFNNIEYKMTRGDMFVLPPFAVHKVMPCKGEEVRIIGCEFLPQFINEQFKNLYEDTDFFDFAYLRPFLVSEDKVRLKINLTGDSLLKSEEILEEMLYEYKVKDRYYEMLLKGDLLKLLTIVIREYYKDSKISEEKEILRKYKDAIIDSMLYIHSKYNEKIHLEDACKHSMMSKTYFCYIFKSLTGKTFNEYLSNLRITKAMELLLNTNMSIMEVCFEVGFNDETYFCKTFKKLVGVSPKQYKKLQLVENTVQR
ncbi:MAG: AraC family transcriptional regulator [Clostridiales bacterium]|nr:AraC family transcriptional regulator [Clostridiales bacterium]